MKQIVSLQVALFLLLTLFIVAPSTVNAETTDEFSYRVLEDGTIEITGYSGLGEQLVIPSLLDGYTVSSIGKEAFMNSNSFIAVTVPDTITNIGENAFYNTRWYDSQPDGLIYLGKVAFQYKGECPSSINLKDDTIAIGDSAFYYCTYLETITVPTTLKRIGNSAFEGCSALRNITIPETVDCIGDKAFMKCQNLSGITIPKKIRYLGSFAFCDCTYLNNITIPETLTAIEPYTFNNCRTMTSVIIPNNITSIGRDAFGGCNFLEDIVIPDSVITIGDSAFSSCTSIKQITIPDSVTSIGISAFYFCRSLTSITIPNSVTYLGRGAFVYCEKLKNVSVPDIIPEIGEGAFDDTPWYYKQPDGIVYLGKMAYQYKGTYPEHIDIKQGTLLIGHQAFSNKNIISATIPDSVKIIYDDSFLNCKNLQTIYGYDDTAAEDYVYNMRMSGKKIQFVSLGSILTTGILGDTDRDGIVSIIDATYIQRKLASIPIPVDFNEALSDADEDSLITIMDATYIQRWLVQLKSNDNIGKNIKAPERVMRISVTDGTYTATFKLNNSPSAKSLYGMLPVDAKVENYGNNEKIFYPNDLLDTADGIECDMKAGYLAYYSPWGNIVMYYGDANAYSGLYLLGDVESGADIIKNLTGSIRIERVK